MAVTTPIDPGIVSDHNARLEASLGDDFAHLGGQLARRGADLEQVHTHLATLRVAVPSWGVGTGGTRFARFPVPGEPRDIHEKLEDCAVIQQLGRTTPTVSPHFPWDRVDDPAALREHAEALGLGFDAVNSNTFQDREGQELSYKFGSFTHTDPAVRKQAVEHNLACIEIGEKMGSKALTVWIGDGGNYPGQQHFRRTLDRYLESLRSLFSELPHDWQMYLEHKLYEPAFYSTVNNDWGVSSWCAQKLGPRCSCLVDLGHHAPSVNIEMVVARLIQIGKLGGCHFNDSKYGDDDLDSGSINPFQLFLIFCELVDAELEPVEGFAPTYMLDQSHNVTDPIESLVVSAIEVHRACVKAQLVDREALASYQEENDAIMALATLKQAFYTDVDPILARARIDGGGVLDPLATYRASGYREAVAAERPAAARGGAGIV